MVNAEISEIQSRNDYLVGERITSVYFGGGSPSVLSIEQVNQLLNEILSRHEISENAEITFECNPDDLNITYLRELKRLGITRLSIGVQSFDDEILKFLNRRHNALQGEKSVKMARIAGFDEISIDIIFGIPGVPAEIYSHSLKKGIELNPEHFSAYNLTIEPGTVFYKKRLQKDIAELDEDEILNQFDFTIGTLEENGYLQYEVSNYAKQGHESKHNVLYWFNGKYLGIGPSAHSYDGNSRQWNISNNKLYINAIQNGKKIFEMESLTETDRYNEYILTGLRTLKGISSKYVEYTFNKNIFDHYIRVKEDLGKNNYFRINDEQSVVLNRNGIYLLNFMIEKFHYSKK